MTSIDQIQNIGVIGAGHMGSGIAQSFASHEYEVRLHDLESSILEDAKSNIRNSLERLLDSNDQSRQSSSVGEVLKRISTTSELSDLSDADLVVEAIVEEPGPKKNLLEEISTLTRSDTIISSNTSSISITELASVTDRPSQFVGLHFFSPVPRMPLVEIVRGLDTSEDVVQGSEEITKRIEKTPVVVNDSPGFVSNRILAPMLNEAAYLLMNGIADKEAIDTVMKLGMNHPMGPLELADAVGLDVCLHVLETLHSDLGEDKYRPCPLLKRKVQAGHLGKKSGQGFYQYN